MPSALDAATRTLETRLQAAFPTTPIAWPNVEFTAPPGQAYLQPWVLWGAGQLSTMGPSKANRVVGVYQVNVWVPLARGAGLSLDMSDLVRTTFNRVVVDSVRCDAPSGPAPLEEEPPWYGVAVSIPFSVEETTSVP
jgi:hypothetical protein